MVLVVKGETLKRLRLVRADTQQALAERAGLSAYRLRCLEAGDLPVRQSTAHKLATALNVPVTELTEVA